MIQKERTEKAKALAQAAQLQMLRYRMNPHFLFNSLNSIRALISENKLSAKSMVTELSEYLRYSLVSRNHETVPLKEEMDSVRHCFNIQKMRYENKLEVSFDIDPAAEEFPIISYLLHPLAENSVKHGMRTSPMPLTIHLQAKIREGMLTIEVCNTGKWLEPVQQEKHMYASTGTGLDNVRRRLENAFPNRHLFEVFEKEEKVHVQLEIRGHREKNMKKPFKALIIDDERLARKDLISLLSVHENITVCGEADDVPSAVKAIEKLNPYVIFLDIQMPGDSGFDLLEKTDVDAHIIFVTAPRLEQRKSRAW